MAVGERGQMSEHILQRIGWETGQALGAISALVILWLCLTAIRGRRLALRSLTFDSHERLGWMALGAATLHATLLLIADRRVVEHIRPTAPVYEWAGMLALLSTIVLTVTAVGALRPRIWPQFRQFEITHRCVASALVLLMAIHVVTTDRYVHAPLGATACIASCMLAILGILLRRRVPADPATRTFAPGERHRTAFITTVALISITGSLFLLYPGVTLALKAQVVRRKEPLLVDFPHGKHGEVQCLQCHHNYKDGTGLEVCINCHRSDRKDLRAGAEARFHDFCLRCHRDPPKPLKKHGPTTGCKTCHRRVVLGEVLA
jgi:hypothetical protein